MSKPGRLEHAGRRFLSTGEFRFIQHSTKWTGHSPHLTTSRGIGQDDEKSAAWCRRHTAIRRANRHSRVEAARILFSFVRSLSRQSSTTAASYPNIHRLPFISFCGWATPPSALFLLRHAKLIPSRSSPFRSRRTDGGECTDRGWKPLGPGVRDCGEQLEWQSPKEEDLDYAKVAGYKSGPESGPLLGLRQNTHRTYVVFLLLSISAVFFYVGLGFQLLVLFFNVTCFTLLLFCYCLLRA